MTKHGKVDSDALARRAPRGRNEAVESGRRSLADLWEDLTGQRPAGGGSRFLEDGGDSFLAARLLASIEDTLLAGNPCPHLLEVILTSTFAEIEQQMLQKLAATPHEHSNGVKGGLEEQALHAAEVWERER